MERARGATNIPRAATAIDRRTELRLPLGCDVRINLLLEEGDEPISASVVNFSGRGISVSVARPIPIETAVRVDLDGKMLLGEVIHCTPGDSAYVAGIELQQSVTWTRDLVRLLEALNNGTDRLP